MQQHEYYSQLINNFEKACIGQHVGDLWIVCELSSFIPHRDFSRR